MSSDVHSRARPYIVQSLDTSRYLGANILISLALQGTRTPVFAMRACPRPLAGDHANRHSSPSKEVVAAALLVNGLERNPFARASRARQVRRVRSRCCRTSFRTRRRVCGSGVGRETRLRVVGWARLGIARKPVATFQPFRAVSAAEKIATIIDSIEICTAACHAEGRGFESRRSRHFRSSWPLPRPPITGCSRPSPRSENDRRGRPCASFPAAWIKLIRRHARSLHAVSHIDFARARPRRALNPN